MARRGLRFPEYGEKERAESEAAVAVQSSKGPRVIDWNAIQSSDLFAFDAADGTASAKYRA
jgi:hypothetical protein